VNRFLGVARSRKKPGQSQEGIGSHEAEGFGSGLVADGGDQSTGLDVTLWFSCVKRIKFTVFLF